MPSTTTNNWQWRFTDEMLSPDLEYKLAGLTLAYRRISENVHHERLHLLANPVEEAEPLAAQPS
ncbi:MAG: hypothetical protein AAF268_14445, partial [Cyanobacteria bacterium P01_A01_bin.3]